jgi:hypothetical protein
MLKEVGTSRKLEPTEDAGEAMPDQPVIALGQ